MSAKPIRKYLKAIKAGKSGDILKELNEMIIDGIEDCVQESSFYTLPLNIISSIVCSVDFTELSKPIETIKSIVSGTSQSYKSEGITILNAFKVEKIPPLDLGQCIEI